MNAAKKLVKANVTEVKTEITAEQRTLYNTIMANLKPFMTDAEGKVIQCSGQVPLSLCYVDLRYQGLRTHKKIQKLRNNWDVNKLTPIILVPHPEECRFAVVDGQGRTIVAPDMGLLFLNAIILMTAPTNPYERLVYEADYFMTQTDEVEPVKPIEKHLARVLKGDKVATDLDSMLNKYGIHFVDASGQRKDSMLGSYTDTYAITKRNGADGLDFIFSIIENAGWKEEVNGYATCIMRSLSYAYEAHQEDREKVHAFLSEELRQIDPSLFAATGRASYPKRDYRVGCILYTEDLICKGLNLERRIYVVGKGGLKVVK